MRAGPYEVKVIQHAGCRRMILRCRKQEGQLTLTVPRGTKDEEIRAFLAKNMDWIRRAAGDASQWKPMYARGEKHWCMGRLVQLGWEAPAGEKAFKEWRNQQLARVLELQLRYWTRRMQLQVTHVTLQEMTSRWGSCRSATGRLTFNTKLGMYDEGLIEETVVHELCHFFHPNHSAAFYAEMTKWLPDWKARKQRRDAMDVRPLPPG